MYCEIMGYSYNKKSHCGGGCGYIRLLYKKTADGGSAVSVFILIIFLDYLYVFQVFLFHSL